MKVALLIVDVQEDFCPGGSLAVKGGDTVVAPLNSLTRAFHSRKLPICFSRDWHPRNHKSFKKNGGIWPEHCVKGTDGAEFHKRLYVPRGSTIISKAKRANEEAYSAFQGTRLEEKLKRAGVGEIMVGGLATDYCVKKTVIGGLRKGFAAYLLTDCIKAVNVRRGDGEMAVKEMVQEGARKISSRRALALLRF